MNAQATAPSGGKLRAYLELFRLPNVFTALADVMMGFLIVRGGLEPVGAFLMLAAASAFLYIAGMVLNDVYDVEVDARERPFRPIPSGRISLVWARMLGYEFLVIGAGLGWLAALAGGSLRSGVVATALAVCVWLYDRVLKKTFLGPLAMGACRFLNVLLGMSAAVAPWDAGHWTIAAGIGLYIVGVTWFARTEARESSRFALALATAVMMAGIGMLAWFPSVAEWPIRVPEGRWSFFWTMIAVLIGWRCVRAVITPTPSLVQTAVKQCILSLIMLDAAVTFAVLGSTGPGLPWAVVILLLLLPTMFLGRWIYST